MQMSIADLLKYAESLKVRINNITSTINRVNLTKTGTRVVSQTTSWTVEEVTEYTINPRALLSELDETSKELRLVQQQIEKLNHTTYVDFDAKF